MIRYCFAILLWMAPLFGFANGWDTLVVQPRDHYHNFLHSIDHDSDGNIYGVGVASQLQLPTCIDTITPTGVRVGFVAKFDSSGACQWVHLLGTATVASVTVSDSGYVFVAGQTTEDVTIGGHTANHTGPATKPDVFLGKFDAQGGVDYLLAIGGDSAELATEVVVDESGNAWIAGRAFGALVLGTDTIATNNTGFVARFDPSGNYTFGQAVGVNVLDIALCANQDPVVCYSGAGANAFGCASTTGLYGIARIDAATGGCVWEHRSTEVFLTQVQSASNGMVIAAGIYYDSSFLMDDTLVVNSPVAHGIVVAQLDSMGVCGWAYVAESSAINASNTIGGLDVDASGNVLVGGSIDVSTLTFGATQLVNAGLYDGYIAKLAPNGVLFGAARFGGANTALVNCVSVSPTGVPHFAADIANNTSFGTINVGSIGGQGMALVRITDALWTIPECSISGRVYHDENASCMADSAESGLAQWIIRAEPGDFITLSDSLGNYHLPVDTGTYTVTTNPIGPQEQLILSTCPALPYTVPLPFQGAFATDIDFAVEMHPCELVSVDIGTGVRRPCFNGQTVVHYTNHGLEPSSPALLVVTLDTNMIVHSASLPYVTQNTNEYAFSMPALGAGESQTVVLYDSLACSVLAQIGVTVCSYATVVPGNTCVPPDSLWDQSTLEVEAECFDASELARIVIRNTGTGNMGDSTDYRIYLDSNLFLASFLYLAAGDSLELLIPLNAQVLHVEVNQAAYHPYFAQVSATLAGCGALGAITGNAVTQFSLSEFALTDAVSCSPTVAAFDPNDKAAEPVGLTANHYIDSLQPIDYKIRFQNTGTDTAFTVVVRDTLSPALDIATFIPGAASHPYTYAIEGGSHTVLVFTFSNILLPDSFVNEPASNGFFQFKIGQMPGNVEGTSIDNTAAIYFDFNPPVITNSVHHTVLDYVAPVPGDSLAIIINNELTLNAGADAIICSGDSVLIGAPIILPNGATLQWTGGPTSTGTADQTWVSPTTTSNYVLTGTLGNATGSDTVVVTVQQTVQPVILVWQNLLTTDPADSIQWYYNGQLLLNATGDSLVQPADGFYQVSLLDANGCTAFSDSVEFITSNVAEVFANHIRVFPNPVSDQLWLELPAIDGNTAYELRDATGRLVLYGLATPNSRTAVNMSEVAPGAYLLTIAGSAGERAVVPVIRQ